MAKKVSTKTITYKISLETLKAFVDKIKDLTKLDSTVIMNFSNSEILLFSVFTSNEATQQFCVL